MGVGNASHPKIATTLARVLTGGGTIVLSVNRTSVRGGLSLNVLFRDDRNGSKSVLGRLLFGDCRLSMGVHFGPVARRTCGR